MGSRTRTRRLATGALCVLALTTAACTAEDGNAANIGMNATTTTAAPSPGTVSIPVTITTDASGTTRALVHISVGGGKSVPVILDTGSAGLQILTKDVGFVRASGQVATSTFGGGAQLTSAQATASVTIGGVSTPASTGISLIQSTGCAPGFPTCSAGQVISSLLGTSGAVGILGIAMADDTAAIVPYSPLLQLDAPYRNGFTLSLPLGGPDSLTLGTPRSTADTVTVPMLAASPSTYPNGMPAWQKDVDLCWTINNNQNGCGTTDLDTGTQAAVITPAGIPGLPAGGSVNPGYPIAVSTPGGTPVWGYTSSTTPNDGLTVFGALPGPTQFNTGIAFFTSHVVGYNAVGGQVLVTP